MNSYDMDNETFLARAGLLGWTVHEGDGCSIELQIDHDGPGDFWITLDKACTATLFEQFAALVDDYDMEEEFDCYHDAKRSGLGGVPNAEELMAELKKYQDELLAGVERMSDPDAISGRVKQVSPRIGSRRISGWLEEDIANRWEEMFEEGEVTVELDELSQEQWDDIVEGIIRDFDCCESVYTAGWEIISQGIENRAEEFWASRIDDGPCREAIKSATAGLTEVMEVNRLTWSGSTDELTERLEAMAKAMSERMAETDRAGAGLDHLIGVVGIADVLEHEHENDTGITKEILLCDDECVYLDILCTREESFAAREAFTEARGAVWSAVKEAYLPTIRRMRDRDENAAKKSLASRGEDAASISRTRDETQKTTGGLTR
ncbi:MAG: hypothetical protein LBK67_11685 [Coriobacteriales bacterium]|jgi:hypothetical protein|nr:hypothetical protein [Coriobacteriales bacterium]